MQLSTLARKAWGIILSSSPKVYEPPMIESIVRDRLVVKINGSFKEQFTYDCIQK